MAQSPPYSGPTGFTFVATPRNAIGQSYDVDLTSDEEAHDRALMMLGGQVTYSYSEVWERARLVCTVRKGE
jgi:hypothetical protein